MVDRLDWDREHKRQLWVKRLYGATNGAEELSSRARAKKPPSKAYYLRKLSDPERWRALKSFKTACDHLIESGDTGALYRWFESLPKGRYREEVVYPFLKAQVGVGLVQRLRNSERHPRFKKFKRYRQLSSLSLDEYKDLVRDAGELLGLKLD